MREKQLHQLDLNLLRIFEALYEEQNMTRAAERLYVTPSAMSHGIKRLREYLDDPLFERRHGKMQPTSQCRRVAPQLLAGLNAVRMSLQQFTEFDPLNSRQRFNLMIHDALEPLYVPALFSLLRSKAPGIELACQALERQQIQSALTSGQADIAIDVARPMSKPIHHQRISRDEFVVLRKKSDLPLTLDTYLQAEHVVVSHRASGKVVEEISLQQRNVHRRQALRCQSYNTARYLLKQQPLLLTVPSSVAVQLRDNDLEILPVPVKTTSLDIDMYWHENSEQDAAINWLREQVTTVSRTFSSH